MPTGEGLLITIGVVVAMHREAAPLLRRFDARPEASRGGFRTWSFSSGPYRCVLILSGMGQEPARSATRALIESERPSLIVSFGIAGALGTGPRIGDIFLGERRRSWENGSFGAAAALTILPAPVRAAVARAAEARAATCYDGTVVTVRGLQQFPPPPGEEAVAEMETAGVAGAAEEYSIPVVSIRSISDTPGQPIPLTMPGGDAFQIRPLVLVRAILRKPAILPALIRLARNSTLAARNLAEPVGAILRTPEVAQLIPGRASPSAPRPD